VNESRTFLFAPALRWRVGRNLDDSYNPIEYIEHIRPTATINTIWKAEPFIFNFRITDGLSESDRGFSYNLGAAYNYEYSEKIELSFYTTAIYGSKTYNQTYFGITSGQTWFGYPEYSARAGLKSIDFGANIKYKLTGAWTIESTAEVLRLTGVAAESPIVRDPNQFMLTLGASYSF
jgi:outer membrane scaffolding protein for murein synthesis (MipA/OmpV family)